MSESTSCREIDRGRQEIDGGMQRQEIETKKQTLSQDLSLCC
jgi:hypothetical protein